MEGLAVVGTRTEILQQIRQAQKQLAGAKRRRDKKAVQKVQAKMQQLEKELKYAGPEF
jgi:DNA-binding protein H-NS